MYDCMGPLEGDSSRGTCCGRLGRNDGLCEVNGNADHTLIDLYLEEHIGIFRRESDALLRYISSSLSTPISCVH